jgi:hypothetical protein
MTGVKLQGVGLVPGVGAMCEATFVSSGVGVAEEMDVVAGSGAAQAARVASIRIVIRIVLQFVFMMIAWTFSRLQRFHLRKGKQDHQISLTVNPSGNGSSGSTT